jgi:hypothetical protein
MKEQSINMIQKLNFKQKHAFNAVMHSVKKGLGSSYLSTDTVEQEKHSFGKQSQHNYDQRGKQY